MPNNRLKGFEMSIKEAERFVATVDSDKALTDRIMASEANEAALTAIIRGAGYDVTLDEIREVALEKSVMSESDLQKIAAGLTSKQQIGIGIVAGGAIVAGAAVAAAI